MKGKTMSDDLIKRKDAIKAFTLNSKGERIPFVDCDNFPVEFPLRYIVDTLAALPPADRPQGEWKHLEGDEWLCSNCGYVVCTEGSWEHPLERGKDYCEHCGAKRKGTAE